MLQLNIITKKCKTIREISNKSSVDIEKYENHITIKQIAVRFSNIICNVYNVEMEDTIVLEC